MRSERRAHLRLVSGSASPGGGRPAPAGPAPAGLAPAGPAPAGLAPAGLAPAGLALRCQQVAEALPGILDGAELAHPEVVAHVERCSACQVELAQYRRLLRALHQLRVVEAEPPVGLLSEVLAQLGEAAQRGAIRSALTGRRVAYLVALAGAAGVAGVAGLAVVWASRGRASSPRPEPGRALIPAGMALAGAAGVAAEA